MMRYETDNKYLMHYNKNHDKLGRFAKGHNVGVSHTPEPSRYEKKLKRIEEKKKYLKAKQDYKQLKRNEKRESLEAKRKLNEERHKKTEKDKPAENQNKFAGRDEYTYKTKLSTQEINNRIDRINLEKKYDAQSKPGRTAVKKILSESGKKTAATLLTGLGVAVGGYYLSKKIGGNEKFLDKIGATVDDVKSIRDIILRGGSLKK